MTILNTNNMKIPTLPKEVSDKLLELSEENTDLQSIFFGSLEEHPSTAFFRFMQENPSAFAIAWIFNQWHVEGESKDKVTFSKSDMFAQPYAIESYVKGPIQYSEGTGTLSLIVEKTDEKDNVNTVINLCEVLGDYGVNKPNAIEKFWGGYMINATNIDNGKHTTENLVKLYKNLTALDGIDVVSFRAETSTGGIKLVSGELHEAKYEITIGEYKKVEG